MSSAVSIDPGVPVALASMESHASTLPRARWWVEVGTIVWLCWVYDAITNLAPLQVHVALQHARDILGLEQALGIDPERALDHWLAGHRTLGLMISDYYDNAHFLVTLGLLGWLWWRRADIYRPLRNSLVVVNVVAFVVFWRYPLAPPRMLAGFTDVVASTHAIGSWHTGALASHANELAAMPSLHIAWALWCSVVLWRISPRASIRACAVLYPCLTAFAVLCTGNHFVLDILGGLVVMAVAMLIVAVAGRARHQLARGRRRPLFAKPALPAYRMSQSCYEVQDRID